MADVFRQAALLRALQGYGLPVPPLLWAEAGEEEIGSPYIAMRWVEAGGNLAVVQQILGHRDLSTTMRSARVTDDLVRREAERVRGMSA